MADLLRLEMNNIEKSFSEVQVLKHINLTLRPGRVLGLLGENGAGKSTLIKILNGDYSKDRGEIFVDGKLADIRTPKDASNLGIQVIYQELNYFPEQTVAENILVGHIPRKSWFIDKEQLYAKASSILNILRSDIDPRMTVKQLSIAQKQIVEIAKSLSKNVNILVMDEPTAALTAKEVESLFQVITDLKKAGISIIYISHHLDEVKQIADDVLVMRDGEVVAKGELVDYTSEDLVNLIVGRQVSFRNQTNAMVTENGRKKMLEVEELSVANSFEAISFQVMEGEIFSIYGLMGSGKEEIGRALFGDLPVQTGRIQLNGVHIRIKNPRQAKRAGIAYIPPERKINGIIKDMSVRNNMTVTYMDLVGRKGFVDRVKEKSLVQEWVNKLKIRLGSLEQEIKFLSGGNQQKVILSRWLLKKPKLLIMTDPTMGVDVGARADIYEMLIQLKEQGLSIILISSDLTEVDTLADRVLVMRNKRMGSLFVRGQFDQEILMSSAMGVDSYGAC